MLRAVGAALFIFNIWRTLEPAQSLRAAPGPDRALPVLDERVSAAGLTVRPAASARGG